MAQSSEEDEDEMAEEQMVAIGLASVHLRRKWESHASVRDAPDERVVFQRADVKSISSICPTV